MEKDFIPDNEFTPDEKQPVVNQPGNLFYQGFKALVGDKAAEPEFSPKGGGITESMSPIDFITPGMVTAPAKMAVQGVKAAVEAAPRILANEVGAAGSMAAKTRPNASGLYSKLEHTIENKMGGSSTPDQIMAMIKNNDVKPDEIKYTKLEEFLKNKINEKKYAGTSNSLEGSPDQVLENVFGKEIDKNSVKVSKDELLSYVRENQLPIQEKVLGKKSQKAVELERQLDSSSAKYYSLENDAIDRLKDSGYADSNSDAKKLIRKAVDGDPESSFTKNAIKTLKDNGFSDDEINSLTSTGKKFQEHSEAFEPFRKENETKFQQYTLPGGENYREKLFTLQNQPKEMAGLTLDEIARAQGHKNGWSADLKREDIDKIKKAFDSQKYGPGEGVRVGSVESQYKSSHFDEPNILAHTRLNDRVDAQGKKHLFVEEIQSDWHQAGRDQGYKGQNPYKSEYDALIKKAYENNPTLKKYEEIGIEPNVDLIKSALSPEDFQKYLKIEGNFSSYNPRLGVPDAPFKKTWHEFVSKNLLNEAARGGYDNVSWTTGAQQGERYPQLIDHVNNVEWHIMKNGQKSVLLDLKKGGESILDLDSSGNIIRGNFSGKNLSEVIGKEQAEKIISADKGFLEGNDLIVGAEGMKGFYDKMIPDYMAKLGKRFGVKPEKTILQAGKPQAEAYLQADPTNKDVWHVYTRSTQNSGSIPQKLPGRFLSKREAQDEANLINAAVEGGTKKTVWTMKITPEMRDSLLKEGLPLFSVGGAMIMGQDANAQQPQGYYNGGVVGYANGGVVDPNFIPDDQFVSDEDTYGTPTEQAKTFATSAASAATFGLSDQALVRAGLMDAEKARLRAETNPGAALVGELTGIGGSLLIPGSAVGRLAKGAEAVTGLVSPTTGKIVSKLINPELYPTAHKVLSRAGSTAIGSALEGGVYGAGKSISEDAIGDHELTAESLLSNAGMGALYGGAIGGTLGGIFGGIKSKGANSTKDVLDNAGLDQGTDFVSQVANSSIPKAEKDGILSGLAKQKSNIKEIEQAAKDLGVEVSVGQRSDSKLVQDTYSMLTQRATPAGVLEQQKIARDFQKVSSSVGDALGGLENIQSKAELGQSLSDSLTGKNEARITPIKQLYSYLKDTGKGIDFTENERLEVMQVVQDWVKEQGFMNGAFGKKFGDSVIDAVAEAKNYDQLDSIAKNLYKSIPGNAYGDKWIAQGIRDVLEKKADDILIDFAEQVGATDVTNEIAMKVAGARAAKTAYREFMQDAQKLANVLGVSKLHGPQHFFDVLAEKRPELIADRIFAKENSRFIKYFTEKFPEEWNMVKQYQKGKIFSDSLKNGEIDIGKAIKKLDKLEPELKKALFTPQELKTIKNADTWLEAFPPNVNPSRTEITRAIRDFFENPTSAALQSASDMAFKAGYKALGLSSGELQKYQMLRKIEKSTIDTQKAISGNIKFALSLGDKEVKRNLVMNNDEKKKLHDDVNEYANNPEKFIDHLNSNTENLYANAPSISGNFQKSAATANAFLASVLPQVPDQKPLGQEYQVSEAEIAKFMRYVDAIHNPTNILLDIKNGSLTKEKLQAVKVVYPKMFSRMQQEAINSISEMSNESKKKMPYKVKMGFSMLLESDLATGLDAKSIIANQSNLLNPNSKQSGDNQVAKISQKGLSSITAQNAILTDSQKTAKGVKS